MLLTYLWEYLEVEKFLTDNGRLPFPSLPEFDRELTITLVWEFPGINKISYAMFRYLLDGFLCWMLLGNFILVRHIATLVA